ncbi:unnamed protein product [Symbiodinium sp. KB8]|nr:unnamed protein product [Symbiodinium sp. KB8]
MPGASAHRLRRDEGASSTTSRSLNRRQFARHSGSFDLEAVAQEEQPAWDVQLLQLLPKMLGRVKPVAMLCMMAVETIPTSLTVPTQEVRAGPAAKLWMTWAAGNTFSSNPFRNCFSVTSAAGGWRQSWNCGQSLQIVARSNNSARYLS